MLWTVGGISPGRIVGAKEAEPMRHDRIDASLFVNNRARLAAKLGQGALAVVGANDVLPTNADGSLIIVPNSDLFYLSGIEQEESILVVFPSAHDPLLREVLFIREPNELLKIWEGHKLSKDEARAISGIRTIKWISDFPKTFHAMMCEADEAWLNENAHPRAVVESQTRDARFVAECKCRFPLHTYRRLAKLMHELRVVKQPQEIDLLKRAIAVTRSGFERVCRMVRPGVYEHEVEAEFAHEFIKNRCKFAYNPIIAGGENSCVLHYNENDQPLSDGELLLIDVGANYANYNADLTRTIPVSGRFTPRQRQVYDAVLRVMQQSIKNATVGKLHRDWVLEAKALMNEELLGLGLIKKEDIEKETPEEYAGRKYFMHGLGHVLGLDVHDVGPMSRPFSAGWVLTVEPGIYIPEEGFGVRIENDILVTENGPVDLMADIPADAAQIEDLVLSGRS